MKITLLKLYVPQNLYKTNFEMDEITITPCPATQGLNVMIKNYL